MSGFAPVSTCPVCGVSYAGAHACGPRDTFDVLILRRSAGYLTGYVAGLETAAQVVEGSLCGGICLDASAEDVRQLAAKIRALMTTNHTARIERAGKGRK